MHCQTLPDDSLTPPIGRPRLRYGNAGAEVWRRLEQVVAIIFAVPRYELRAAKRRRAQVAFARQVTMYVAHTVFGMSYRDIGRLCRRDRKTVAHACEVVEMRRDDPAINGVLALIEAVSGALAIDLADDLRVRS